MSAVVSSEALSWVAGADDHADWTLHNLPFGIFSTAGAIPQGAHKRLKPGL
jgi:hypothetical protein